MGKLKKNFIFGLYDMKGKQLDQTSLDEDDPKLAKELFLDEFGWKKKYPKNWKHLEIGLIEITTGD